MKSIKLLSTCKPLLDPDKVLAYDGLTRFVGGKGFLPKLGTEPGSQEVPFDDWWAQLVLVFGESRFTRKSLVLVAANKDGGLRTLTITCRRHMRR